MARHGPGRIRIRRRGYHRKSFTEHRGGHIIHVKSTYAIPTTFTETDRGRHGRGPRLFRLNKGGLHGWHHTQDSEVRHEHLRAAAERSSWLTVFHRLDALAKVSKRTQRDVSEKAREDANWVRREHIH
jgi:hypothetical protein